VKQRLEPGIVHDASGAADFLRDPVGTLLLPLVGSIFGAATGHGGGFGWGKPVRIRFYLVRAQLYAFWVSPNVSGESLGYVAAGGPGLNGSQDSTTNAGSSASETSLYSGQLHSGVLR